MNKSSDYGFILQVFKILSSLVKMLILCLSFQFKR